MCVNPEPEKPEPFTFALWERARLAESWYSHMSLAHEDVRLSLLFDEVERLIRNRS